MLSPSNSGMAAACAAAVQANITRVVIDGSHSPVELIYMMLAAAADALQAAQPCVIVASPAAMEQPHVAALLHACIVHNDISLDATPELLQNMFDSDVQAAAALGSDLAPDVDWLKVRPADLATTFDMQCRCLRVSRTAAMVQLVPQGAAMLLPLATALELCHLAATLEPPCPHRCPRAARACLGPVTYVLQSGDQCH